MCHVHMSHVGAFLPVRFSERGHEYADIHCQSLIRMLTNEGSLASRLPDAFA